MTNCPVCRTRMRSHRESGSPRQAHSPLRYLIGPVVLLLLAMAACATAPAQGPLTLPTSPTTVVPPLPPSASPPQPPSPTVKPPPKPPKPPPTSPKPPPPTTTKPPANCDPSDPNVCLHDGIGDYDCAGGS